MKLWFARYELTPKESLNSLGASQARQGALLRIEEHGMTGYADLHPWPEFGDADLKTQLDGLRDAKPLPLAQRSIHWSQVDSFYRGQNVSAFNGLQIPESHKLVTDVRKLSLTWFQDVYEQGFRAVKLKLGRNLQEELEALKGFAMLWPEELLIRIDFNSKPSLAEVSIFLSQLPERLRRQIEFIEDPVPFENTAWNQLRDRHFALALDWLESKDQAEQEEQVAQASFDVLVLKPAQQSLEKLVSVVQSRPVDFVVTSSMDHPLGQMTAAFAAARLGKQAPERMRACGLLSHSVYQDTEFSRALQIEGCQLLPTGGSGFGFDELLHKQDWRRLI